MSDPVKEAVEYKVRRAVGTNALHKIGKIVAEERRSDEGNARAVRRFLRYGWLVALGAALVCAYWTGVV